ncbi:MAG: glutathione S-transferase family protein [Gammaproteobacteria bacterium]
MIELYAIHWSSFVEKVRWALDYKQLEWQQIDIDAFSKKELRQLEVERVKSYGRNVYTVPTILDSKTDTALSDSTPILEYLEKTYPDKPKLFPGSKDQQIEIKRVMLKLDSELGPDARRIGYMQCIIEIPQIIPKYFSPEIPEGSLRSWLHRVFISGVLIRRFSVHTTRQDRAFEKLEALLIPVAEKLANSLYLVGNKFSAADLTLVALLRPLRVVPFFREHEKLQALFDWQTRLFAQHKREPHMLYEKMTLAQRLNVGYSLGKVPWLANKQEIPAPEDKDYDVAVNDQHYIGRKQFWMAPWFYLNLRYLSGLKKLKLTA